MNSTQKSRQFGFTVIELVVVSAFVLLAGILVFVQIKNIEVANADMHRKTAINAIYYALEEVYHKQHNNYPEHLSTTTLPSVDPELFTDPDGFVLGGPVLTEEELQKVLTEANASEATKKRLASIQAGKSPNYHYEPTDCNSKNECKSYTLRADLSKESPYIKESRNN